MVFWFFRKDPHHEIKKEVEGIHKRLHTSFSNIKKDMSDISEWLSKHDLHKEQLEKQLELHQRNVQKQFQEVQKQIDTLFILIDGEKNTRVTKSIVSQIKEVEEAPAPSIQTNLPSLETLTSTQKMILRAILAKLTESGRGWCSYKEVAEELYPDKDYNKVRPTISSYLNHIEELGVIKRKRVSKESYIAITDYGNKVLKNLKEKKEQKVKNK